MKAQRLYGFLVVLLVTLFQGEVWGQVNKQAMVFLPKYRLFIDPGVGIRITSSPFKVADWVGPDLSFFGISRSLYADRLGFFCKKELQLQKLTSIPFRFRLGSLDYVNYLEQKPNAIKPR